MPDQTLDALIASFKADLESTLSAGKVAAAVADLAMILDQWRAVVRAMLAIVPARRLGREMAVAALSHNQEHLVDFMREHCPADEDVLALGRWLAHGVAELLGVPRQHSPSYLTYRMSGTPRLVSAPPKPIDGATIDVFYATDRQHTGKNDPYTAFGAERGELSFGQAQVTIPRDHKLGKLEEPTWWKLEFSPDPAKHVTIKSLTPVEGDAFFQSVGRRAGQGDGQALVFIHGFNVAFDEALRRTGQLAYDLNFDGAPILYSWPSDGKFRAYMSDANNAEWTRPHLVAFLKSLAACAGVRTIHLVAHSMGNRALLNALDRLVADDHQARFAQTILTAPDVDVEVFKDLVTRCRTLAARVTLYASKTDTALEVSRAVNGHPRAGDAGNGLVVMNGLDTVDATEIDTSFIGHGYYGDNRSVLSDLFYAIRGAAPSDRHGLRQTSLGILPYWVFKR